MRLLASAVARGFERRRDPLQRGHEKTPGFGVGLALGGELFA